MSRTCKFAGLAALAGGLIAIGAGGCRIEEQQEKRRIQIDGSSTVLPISTAAAREFKNQHPDVNLVVERSGTGGGFKKFCVGETDINNASRPIAPEELESCKQNGIEYIELTVATDGISVVVNPENDWCDALTVEQLRELWKPGSRIERWSQLNPQANWPDERIKLYGPDTESGTFDYFTEEVIGQKAAIRDDYTPSPEDSVLVTGVAQDKYALGYFGFAYYVKSQEKLKALAISPTGDIQDAVKPTPETIEGGAYKPLSRPLFVYVNKASLRKPQVRDFLKFLLAAEGQDIVDRVGYVRVGGSTLERERQELNEAIKAVE